MANYNDMTPTPNSPNDSLERRLDTLERRQDDRHAENTRSLDQLHSEIKPVSAAMLSLVGDVNYPGRVGIAERDIIELNRAVAGLNKTIARWSGAIIAVFAVIEAISWFVKK